MQNLTVDFHPCPHNSNKCFLSTYYVPRSVLNTSHVLNFSVIPWSKSWYHSYFTSWTSGVQRILGHLSKYYPAKWWASWDMTQVVLLQSLLSQLYAGHWKTNKSFEQETGISTYPPLCWGLRVLSVRNYWIQGMYKAL